ncbi:MAG: ankyrin repeat domain-containing protein [Planctomycetota bacterium]|nr:MAG: ankyrin repeat domain-containing protein [Planctomycetota bacterium]
MSAEELLTAALNNDVGEIRRLLDAGVDPDVTNHRVGNSALYNATYTNQIDAVRCLLACGADPNLRLTYRSPVDRRVERHVVALMYARSGEGAEALLGAGAEVDAADSKGVTALMRAAHGGSEEVVRVLLNHGANRSRRATNGASASDIAAARIADYQEWIRAGASRELVEKRIELFARIKEILEEEK